MNFFIAKLTLEEHEDFAPGENSSVIEYTTADEFSVPQERKPAQLPTMKSDTGVTDLGAVKFMANHVLDGLEQEPGPGVSDSEDEHDGAPRTHNMSERRKAQNSKFSAW